MKFKIVILTLTALIISANISFGQLYGGLGSGYITPFSKFNESNKPAMSYIVNLENRYYCKLWYGIKFEYAGFDSASALTPGLPYYNNMLNVTPNIRYNFLGLNCYDNVVFPYLQFGLSISSFGRSDDSPRLGLGALGGGGMTYGFNLFNTCMMLDANASFNVPNIILKSDKRDNIEYLHINLNLNVKL